MRTEYVDGSNSMSAERKRFKESLIFPPRKSFVSSAKSVSHFGRCVTPAACRQVGTACHLAGPGVLAANLDSIQGFELK
jgi:hypothetical protein